MTRSLRLSGLLLVLVLGAAVPAHAGLIDVLEELSGPGPFGRIIPRNVLFSGFCHSVADKDNRNISYVPTRRIGIPEPEQINVVVAPAQSVKSAQGVQSIQSTQGAQAQLTRLPSHMPCFFLDARSVVTVPDDNFPRRSSAFVVDSGVTFPITRPLEIGVGAGFVRFHTGDISRYRFTFTPMRFVVKPLLLVPKWRKSTKLDFLKYYIKETIIVGRLRGEDFGVSNDVFDNKTWKDYVTSGGFIIDVFELLD